MLLASLPARAFARRWRCLALTTVVAFVTVQFAAQAWRFQTEPAAARTVLRHAPATSAPMGTLIFGHRSVGFGRLFRMTHFLPMYFTIDQGGLSTQFWGRYTPHLPVGWRPGKQPEWPADWEPWRFMSRHLRSVATVFVEWPPADAPVQDLQAAERVRRILAARTSLRVCAQQLCLFDVRR